MKPRPPAAAAGRSGAPARPARLAGGKLAAALMACAVLIPAAEAVRAQQAERCACPAWPGFAAWARATAGAVEAGGGAASGASADGASGAPAAGASGPAAGGAPGAAAAGGSGALAADGGGRESAPVAIHAEQLEWLGMAGGAREVRFHGGVQVAQGDLQLQAGEVWARYPAAGGAVSALDACGDVRIRQGLRSARCACVGFERATGRVVCSGAPAELAQRCEQVRGRRIAFLAGSGRFFVEGEARVRRRPGCEAAGGAGAPAAVGASQSVGAEAATGAAAATPPPGAGAASAVGAGAAR